MNNFLVVKVLSRRYSYAIRAPQHVKWAIGPEHTFGWYRRKRDAQQWAAVLHRGSAESAASSAGASPSRP
jgi:hypothetical protein